MRIAPVSRHCALGVTLVVMLYSGLMQNAAAVRGGGGGGARAGGANVRSPDINRAANVNHNVNRSANVNQNVNVNRNVNVDVDGRGYYRAPVATAAAVTAGVALTAAAVGSIAYSIPPSCVPVSVYGATYQQCGSTWYQPQYAGTQVTYVVVNPPR